jgi:1-acyl-sn-glycerol-3-phosphate acyltransferase
MVHQKTNKRQGYSALTRLLGRGALRALGWRWEGGRPDVKKCVVIAAPHTSNWDLLFMLLGSIAMEIPAVFMMKESVFRWPLGVLWRWCGGIPVNRRAASTVVEQMVQAFDESEAMYFVITPEGTRKSVKYWKLGFYQIACGAKAPILPAWVDYKRKRLGVGPLIEVTGDIETDFGRLRDFYEGQVGVSPQYNERQAQRASFTKASAVAKS